MVRRVTLDTNCLLDLEERTERAPAVRALISLHNTGDLTLSVPAIMASERQRGGVYLSSFAEFTDRLSSLGVGHLPLLPPMGYWDVGFWDHMLWTDDAMIEFERQIHDVLHPDIQFEYGDHCRELAIGPEAMPPERRWRNAKCDAQVLWSHIHHGGELLVTNHLNFIKQSKLPRLIELGAGAIVQTHAALALLDAAP
ncbi:MAG TPA: hypothetical protein VGP25_02020 [Gemmatimonadaceae bacterium]|jgi:hypothetical protein|nr:hypothetical protein [Gemmatimonadaceae bacterium]